MTTLAAGDIAIIGYNSDNSDTFSFVVLKTITAGTVINFTDQSWNGSAFVASGTDSTITFTASGTITAGTVITSANAGFSGSLNLDDTGDTIFAYQGPVNAPTQFLYGLELGDGNNTFNGTLTNTGLTAGTTAVGVGFDNAYYGGPSTGIEQTQLTDISNANAWIGSDTVRQTPESGPLLPPDVQIWTTNTGGAGGGLSHVDDNAGVASNLATFFANNIFLHPAEITFDTVHNKVFIADDDGFTTKILEGSISQIVNNPGATPTFTVLYERDDSIVHNDVRDLEVDVQNHLVYFLSDTKLETVSYNPSGASTANQTPTLIATTPSVGFEFDLDLPNNTAYFVDSEFQTEFVPVAPGSPGALPDPNSPTGFSAIGTGISENAIYQVNDLTPANPNANTTRLPFNPEDTSGNTPADAFPGTDGTLSDVVVDNRGTSTTADDRLVFTSIGANFSTAGVFTYNLVGNPNGNWSALWTQPASGTLGADNNTIQEIHVDPANSDYFITIQNSLNNGTAGIYVGSLTTPGTPTLFQAINGTVGGTAEATGITLDHQPTLSVTTTSPTYTEDQTNSPSTAGTAVILISAATTSDPDTTGFTDQMAGATVAITGGFLSGASHQDTLTFTNSGGITGSYNSTTGVLTFTGASTFAAYQTVLQSVHFTDSGDNPTDFGNDTSRTISWSVSDGLISSDVRTTTITVVGVDDAPVNNGVSGKAGNEDTQIAITGLSVTDVDADPANQNITVDLTVLHGTLTVATNVANGLTAGGVSSNDSAHVTLNGTQNAINATLASATGVEYQGVLNFNTTTGGSETLTILSNDQGLNGTGGPLSDTDTLSITVNPVNDSPILSNVGPSATVTEQTAALLDNNVTVSDVDLNPLNGGAGSYTGASLTIARNGGASAQDTFSFDTSGGTFTFDGTNLQSGGLTFATVTNSGGTLTISFTGAGTAATTALVNDVIDHVQYTNTSDDPPASITLNYSFNDGSPGNSQGSGATGIATGSTTVNITPVNDPPTLTATGATTTYTENGAGVDLFSTVSVSAVEAADKIHQVVLTVSGLADGTNEILHVDGTDVTLTNGTWVTTLTNGLSAVVSGTGSSVTVTLSKTGGVTSGTIGTIVDGMTFADNGDNPTGGDRIVTLTSIQDTGGTANGGIDTTSLSIGTTVHVVPVNDAPIVDLNGAGVGTGVTLAYSENAAATAIGPSGVTTDVDSTNFNGGSLTVHFSANGAPEDQLSILTDGTVTVAGGVVSVGGNAVGTVSGGANDADLVVSFNNTGNATPASISTLIDHIAYADNSDDPSTLARTLTFSVDDGDGGNSPGTATATINVTATNDAPHVSAPASYSGTPNVAITVTGITFSDVDSEGGAEVATFTAASGTFAATSGGGVTVGGTPTALTLTGTTAALDSFITGNNLTYTTATSQSIGVSINDQGHTGTPSTPLSDSINVSVIVDVPPVVDLNGASPGTGTTLAYTENDPATAIAPAGVTTDSDSTDFNGGSLTIHFSANGAAEDQLSILTDGTVSIASGVVSVGGNAVGTASGGVNGADLVVSFNNTGNATPASISTLIEHVTYADNSENPSTAARTLTFTVDDGDGATGNATATINVTAVNDPAVISGTTTGTVAEAGGVANAIPGTPTATATLTDTDVDNTPNTFQAVSAGAATTNHFGTYGVTAGGTWTYTLDNTNATVQALNTGSTPLTDSFTVLTTDGTSQQISITINGANDAPTIAVAPASVIFTEDNGSVQVPSSVTVGDVDNPAIVSATVNITGFFNGAGDNLAVDTSGTGITASYVVTLDNSDPQNVLSETLTLTGSDTFAHYQQVLDTLQFESTSDNPTNFGANPTRTLAWTVNDGSTDSAAQNTTVNITPVNDPPFFANIPFSASYAPGGVPKTIAPAATVNDPDNQTLASASVQITSGLLSGDELSVNGVMNGSSGPISWTYNAGSGLLSFSGTASLLAYQTLIDEVQYHSSVADPTNGRTDNSRVLDWTLNDGQASNGPPETTININSPPVVDLSAGAAGTGFTTTFTENGTAVAIAASDVLITDANDTVEQSATVVLTNAQAADSLQAAAVSALTLTASVDTSVAGQITVTYSGTASLADYQTVLNHTLFSNSSENPSAADRIVTVVVNDGIDNSNTATATVHVISVDDAPVIVSNGGGDAASVSIPENSIAVTTVHATDVDSPTITYGIAGGADASLFHIDPATGALAFVAAPDFEHPTDSDHNNSYIVQVSASDGSLADTQTITVNVTNLPEVPTLDAGFYGDFGGDHRSDLLVRNGTELDVLQMNGGQIQSSTALGPVGVEWHADTTADFNGDGKADVLWRNDDGTVAIWQMNGAQIASNTGLGKVGAEWNIAGTGDFNGDHDADILWRANDGTVAEWQMNGSQIASNASLGKVGAEWHIEGTGDFNGDGHSDILWRAGDGTVALWEMNGAQIASNVSLGKVGAEWHIEGAGDFNGDGTTDILWQANDGTIALWEMSGGHIAVNAVVGQLGPEWHLQGTGDFNGDGNADILFRNDNGSVMVWEMNGTHVAAQVTVSPLAVDSTLAVHHYDLI